MGCKQKTTSKSERILMLYLSRQRNPWWSTNRCKKMRIVPPKPRLKRLTKETPSLFVVFIVSADDFEASKRWFEMFEFGSCDIEDVNDCITEPYPQFGAVANVFGCDCVTENGHQTCEQMKLLNEVVLLNAGEASTRLCLKQFDLCDFCQIKSERSYNAQKFTIFVRWWFDMYTHNRHFLNVKKGREMSKQRGFHHQNRPQKQPRKPTRFWQKYEPPGHGCLLEEQRSFEGPHRCLSRKIHFFFSQRSNRPTGRQLSILWDTALSMYRLYYLVYHKKLQLQPVKLLD